MKALLKDLHKRVQQISRIPVDQKLIDIIKLAVSEELKFNMKTFDEPGREKHVIKMVQLSGYLMRIIGGYSYEDIGRILKRDHCTALYFVKKYNGLYETTPKIKAQIDRLKLAITTKYKQEQ